MVNSEFEKDGVKPSASLGLTPLREASGGTCNAYAARLFGKKIFIKEIKREFADNARMLAAFKKEAEIGFRLDHPNLSKYIYAEGVLPSERYIVQEFIDGLTLPDFIKTSPSYFENKKNVERFLREFADVIDYLHSNQIVHLDLKPENILISRVGTSLKLVDLGFCASDFYDDTRGFTLNELAPEGSIKPEERGAESDFYGIGKILTYIRTNTIGFPKKNFRKLEASLLLPDPTKRVSSKDEIEKYLGNRGGKGNAWFFAFGATMLVILAAVIFNNRISVETMEEVPAKDTDTILVSPVINQPETRIVAKEELPSEQPAEHNEIQNNTMAYANNTHAFPVQSYENLKAEMTVNINKNFAEFEKMLSAFVNEKKFLEEDYKTIHYAYREALLKTFDTDLYKTKYKDLSPSLIDDTMVDLLQSVENKSWGPVLKNYNQQCKELAEGSSK